MLRGAVRAGRCQARAPARAYSAGARGKGLRLEVAKLRETISRQKEREEWFSNKQVYDFGLFKKKMIPPYAIPHPTPAWVGPSKDKILYDQGKCKILYMNDLEHGNILDPEMCADMHNWLLNYEAESPGHTTSMIIRGSGTRFFSTGYDMKRMFDSAVGAARPSAKEDRAALQQNRELAYRSLDEWVDPKRFKPTSYGDLGVSGVRSQTLSGLHLAHLLFYTKNFTMSLVNGLCMFLHTPVVIATESSVFSAPYCEVGWFPDCGVTKILASLPNYLGYYLALTGARLTGADLYHAGLASHYIPLHALNVMKQGLDSIEDREDWDKIFLILEAAQQSRLPPFSFPQEQLDVIKQVFSLPSIERILGALDDMQTGFSIRTATRIRKHSPVATKVTFELLKRATELPFSKVLEADWAAAYRMARLPDVREGLRAWVHGDDRPNWFWPRIENIPKEEIDLILSPLPEEYRFRPSTEDSQSSELRLRVEAGLVEFTQGWQRMLAEGKPPKKLWTDYLAAANYYGEAAATRFLEKSGFGQFETFEDRKIAFGDAEQHYEQKLPYKPSPWAQRLDVVQRIQTHTMLEADRREKEAEATKQKLQKYEDEHIKSGGQPLKLLETQDFKDPEDPDFFQPGAHESKIEEMFEMAFDGQIDVIPDDQYTILPPSAEAHIRDAMLHTKVPRLARYF